MKKLGALVLTVLTLALATVLTACGGGGCDHYDNDGDNLCDNCEGALGPRIYTVTVIDGDSTVTHKVEHGSSPSVSGPTPREGYDFVGWMVESDKHKGLMDRVPSVECDMTVTAKYEAKRYTITYVGNNDGNPTSYKTGETVELTVRNSGGSTVEIAGWYLDPEFTEPVTVISGRTGDITLYTKAYYLPFSQITVGEMGVALGGYSFPYTDWAKDHGGCIEIPSTYRGKPVLSVDFGYRNYSEITDIIIPSTVESLMGLPTTDSLASVHIDSENQSYKNVDGSVYSKDGKTLYRAIVGSGNYSFTVPEGVERLCRGAIPSAIKSLVLPTTLTEIVNDGTFAASDAGVAEIYNLSSLSISVGSSEHGRIAKGSYAVNTSLDTPSIFKEEGDFLFRVTEEAVLVQYLGSDTAVVTPDAYGNGGYAVEMTPPAFVTELTFGVGVRRIGEMYGLGTPRGALRRVSFKCGGVEFEEAGLYYALLDQVFVDTLEQWLSFSFASPFDNPLSADTDPALVVGGSVLKDIVIPAGSSVGKHAFYGYSHAATLTVSEGVERIEEWSFGSTSLTSVSLGEGLLYIGGHAFERSDKLCEVRLPESLRFIGYAAFDQCPSAVTSHGGGSYVGKWLVGTDSALGESLTVRDGTLGIASSAVTSRGLKTITLCASIKYFCPGAVSASELTAVYYNAEDALCTEPSLSGGAFSNAGGSGDGITLYIGKNVRTVPDYLFSGDMLYGMYYTNPEIVNIVFSEDGALVSVGERAFYNCISLTSVSLPEGLLTVGTDAFGNCKAVTEIILPSTVTTLGGGAFVNCHALKTVYYNAVSAELASTSSVFTYSGTADGSGYSMIVGNKVQVIPAYIACYTGLSSLVFAGGSILSAVGDLAFSSTNLQRVELPPSATTLGSRAFSDCYGLTEVVGEGLTSVAEDAFYGCNSLPEDFADSVYGNIRYRFNIPVAPVSKDITWAAFKKGSVIPDGFFHDHLALTHVYIPEGCSLGTALFSVSSQEKLSERLKLRVLFEGDYEAASGWRSVYGEYQLFALVSAGGTNTTLGSSATGVRLTAEGIAYLPDDDSVPPSAKVMGYFASSEELTVGEYLDGYLLYEIDGYAFAHHTGLGKVTVKGAYSIGEGAFGSSSVTELTLIGVRKLGSLCFGGCSSLTVATLGSLEEIAPYAFAETALTSVSVDPDCTAWSIAQLSEGGTPTLTAYTFATAAEMASDLTDRYYAATWLRNKG